MGIFIFTRFILCIEIFRFMGGIWFIGSGCSVITGILLVGLLFLDFTSKLRFVSPISVSLSSSWKELTFDKGWGCLLLSLSKESTYKVLFFTRFTTVFKVLFFTKTIYNCL